MVNKKTLASLILAAGLALNGNANGEEKTEDAQYFLQKGKESLVNNDLTSALEQYEQMNSLRFDFNINTQPYQRVLASKIMNHEIKKCYKIFKTDDYDAKNGCYNGLAELSGMLEYNADDVLLNLGSKFKKLKVY